MPTIGHYSVVVRPAMAVLATAVLLAVLVPPVARMLTFQALPSYGYVNPDYWRFDTRGNAGADIMVLTPDGKEVHPTPPAKGVPTYNSDRGFDVIVTKAGNATDGVFLRNALNRDHAEFSNKDLTMTFEAKTPTAFPLLVTLRDGRPGMDKQGALWSCKMDVKGNNWEAYHIPIPASAMLKSPNLCYILAVHLGGQKGNVAFRRIHVR